MRQIWDLDDTDTDTGLPSSLLNSMLDGEEGTLLEDTGSHLERGYSKALSDTLGSRLGRTPRASTETGGGRGMLQQLVSAHMQQRALGGSHSGAIQVRPHDVSCITYRTVSKSHCAHKLWHCEAHGLHEHKAHVCWVGL